MLSVNAAACNGDHTKEKFGSLTASETEHKTGYFNCPRQALCGTITAEQLGLLTSVAYVIANITHAPLAKIKQSFLVYFQLIQYRYCMYIMHLMKIFASPSL